MSYIGAISFNAFPGMDLAAEIARQRTAAQKPATPAPTSNLKLPGVGIRPGAVVIKPAPPVIAPPGPAAPAVPPEESKTALYVGGAVAVGLGLLLLKKLTNR